MSGQVSLTGTVTADLLSLTAADAALTIEGSSAASSLTAGDLVETGSGDFITVLGLGTVLDVVSMGPITQGISAAGNGFILLPSQVTDDGGTLYTYIPDSTIQIGGTAPGDDTGLVIENGATLSGSGTLSAGYVLSSNVLEVLSAVTVLGLVDSTDFTVLSLLQGTGTINVEAGGYFSASLAIEETEDDESALLFTVQNDATIELPGDRRRGNTIAFVGADGVAEFELDAHFPAGSAPPLPEDYIDEASQITGFASGDRLFGVIDREGGVAGASFNQTGGTGTLAMAGGDGEVAATFVLQGTYTISDFVVTVSPINGNFDGAYSLFLQVDLVSGVSYGAGAGSGAADSFTYVGPSGGAWGDAANWFDVTTGAAASVAPGAGDTAAVVGSVGPLYTVLTQAGVAGTLSVTGNVAIDGDIAVGTAMLATAGADLLVTNGGALTATSLSITGANAVAEAFGNYPTGAGGYIDVTSAATLGAGAVLAASGGGRLQVGSLTIEGGDGTTNSLQIGPSTEVLNDGSFSLVPNNSAITIGTADDATSGNVMIDPGATLTDLSPASNPSEIGAQVVDDGTLVATDLTLGGLAGDGIAQVQPDGSLDSGVLASGAAIAFTIDAGGNLYVVPETQFTGGSISWVGTGGGLSVSANGVYPNPYILTPMVGFASGDSVELEDPGVVTAAYTQTIPAGGTVALLDSSGNLLGSLALQGNYVADPFIVTGNNADFVNIALAEPAASR